MNKEYSHERELMDESKDREWFTCECGYHGTDDELTGKEDDTTLYCPICDSPFWVWDSGDTGHSDMVTRKEVADHE